MEERVKCVTCDRNFKDEEGLQSHNKAKHPELVSKERKPLNIKKIRNGSLVIVSIVGILSLIAYGISNIQTLPPTDIDGHIEVNPPSHILKEPLSIAIQKHMLEHADGIEKGREGIIINYNCKDYECEEDLINNLEAFATKYDYVYVAPFKRMDAKIALTKLNKIEILEEFDNEKIEKFILS